MIMKIFKNQHAGNVLIDNLLSKHVIEVQGLLQISGIEREVAHYIQMLYEPNYRCKL